jgi:hypothetical protein
MSLLSELREAAADLHVLRLMLEALYPAAAAIVQYKQESLNTKPDDEATVVDVDYEVEWQEMRKQMAIARGERPPGEPEEANEDSKV